MALSSHNNPDKASTYNLPALAFEGPGPQACTARPDRFLNDYHVLGFHVAWKEASDAPQYLEILQTLPMSPKHHKGNKLIYNHKYLTVYTSVECHSVRDVELPMNAITLKKKNLGVGNCVWLR